MSLPESHGLCLEFPVTLLTINKITLFHIVREALQRAMVRDLILVGALVKKNSNNPANLKRSAELKNKYWNAIQKNVTGNGFAYSSCPRSVATLFLLITTNAATAIAGIDRTKPIPISCSDERTGLVTTALLRKTRVFVGVSVGSEPCFNSLLGRIGSEGLEAKFAMALLGVLLMQVLIVAATENCCNAFTR